MYLCTKIQRSMRLYVKEIAKSKGISLTDIFNELGLKSYPSFLRTLDNCDNLKFKQLEIIATKLGCTIDDLKYEPGTSPTSGRSFKCPHCGGDIHVTLD